MKANWRQRMALAVLPLVLAGCATQQAIVPLLGIRPDLVSLTGEWYGTYLAEQQEGRGGSIVFRLDAKSDTARGDVLMTQEMRNVLHPVWAQSAPPQSQLLAITFVYVAGDTIRGELDEYVDPVCGCRLHTTFTGYVQGDVITGNYRSQHLGSGLITRGKWRVTRRLQ